MTRAAYLTIDDTPSARTDDLVDALFARNVPAILFCRGDLLDHKREPVIRAIQKGFVVGNHGYTHKRASILGLEATCDSIRKCDAIIDDCYAKAGIPRPGKYYRFAYMDRGMGPWFVEPDTVPPQGRAYVEAMISEGLANDPGVLPTAEGIETKNSLQAFLSALGYIPVPFSGVTHEFYARSEMARAIDAGFTFSTSDWALTARHKGKYGFETIDDLKKALDSDPYLARDDSAHIILAHDQDEIHEVTLALVDHMLNKDFTFKDIK